jgi:hypothetical protein
MANRIEVFTENYEEVYGRKPRGKGTWAFFIVSSRGTDFNEPIIKRGTYSQAKAEAIREARSQVGGFQALIVGT